jgi:hypothetical protein
MPINSPQINTPNNANYGDRCDIHVIEIEFVDSALNYL